MMNTFRKERSSIKRLQLRRVRVYITCCQAPSENTIEGRDTLRGSKPEHYIAYGCDRLWLVAVLMKHLGEKWAGTQSAELLTE